MSGTLIERLREQAELTRDCTVCDGDGIKESGRLCGGCDGTGKVLVHRGPVRNMMIEAANALSALSVEQEPVAWQVREKSTQFDDCEWGEWHQVVPDFAARVQRDGGRINDHTIGDVRALVPASALSTAIRERDAARKIIGECAGALPNGAFVSAEMATIEFMAKVPDEIEAVCDRLQAEATSAIRERDKARAEVKALNAIRQANYEAMKLMGAKIENGSPSVNALARAEVAEAQIAELEKALEGIDNLLPKPSLPITHAIKDIVRATLTEGKQP